MYFVHALTKSLLCLGLFLSVLSLSAQETEISNPSIDSLEALLQKQTREKQKIKIWAQLARLYDEVDFEKAIAYADKMIVWAEKNQDDTLWVKGHLAKANGLLGLGEVKEARSLYEQALERSKQINNQLLIAHSYGHIGRMIIELGEVEEARQHFQDALTIYQSLEKLPDMARMQNAIAVTYAYQGKLKEALTAMQNTVKTNQKLGNLANLQNNYYNLGSLHYELSNYAEGIKAHQKALEIGQKLGNRLSVAESYHAIANGYQYQTNNVRALEMYQKSLSIGLELKNQRLLAATYVNMSAVYGDRSDHLKKLEYDQKALELYQKIEDKSGQAHTYNSMGRAYKNLKNYPEALSYYQNALAISLEIEERKLAATIYAEISYLYFEEENYEEALQSIQKTEEMNQDLSAKSLEFKVLHQYGRIFFASQKVNQAIRYGEQAYELAQDIDGLDEKYLASDFLSGAYESQGNYQKALGFHKVFTSLKDSLVNADEIKKFTTLENEYQYTQEKALTQAAQEKKELELANNIQQQKNLRNIFILGFGLVLILVFFIYRGYLIKQKANVALAEKNEVISLQAEELKVTNETLAEMDRFKQDMTGMLVHDLKNPLNAIIGLTETEYQPQYYAAIHASGQTMLNLVNNILDVQKFEEAKIDLQLQKTHIKTISLQAYQQVAYLYKEKNIQFNVAISEQWELDLDEELITRVLINLLHNAGKYTPNNGQVTILAESLAKTQGAEVKIKVIDNGVGISPELLPSVFDKYSQAKMPDDFRTQSTGLGLTFCKLVVEAHQGEIGVESQVDLGSTFWFSLPAAMPLAPSWAESTEQESTPITPSSLSLSPDEKKILLPLVEKIREHDIFEVTSVKAILKSMEEGQAEPITQWKIALEDSMYTGNNQRFKELLQMVSA